MNLNSTTPDEGSPSAENRGHEPQGAADHGTVPHDTAAYRSMRQAAARKESHILSVKEVARLFESAGVARIERSIVNWCQPNRQGVARLDAFFDTNERKWFITPQSVERAIVEEKAKASNDQEQVPPGGADYGKVRHDAAPAEAPKKPEAPANERGDAAMKSESLPQLEKEILDLKILNGGKDFLIDQLRKERDGFIHQLIQGSHRIGELETELRQLAAGSRNPHSLPPTEGERAGEGENR